MASYKMDHRALTRSTDLKKILYIVIHNKIQNLDNDLILLVTSQKRKEKKNLILLFYFYAFYPSWSCHYSFSKKSLPNPYKERKKRKIKSSILNSFNSLFYQKKKKQWFCCRSIKFRCNPPNSLYKLWYVSSASNFHCWISDHFTSDKVVLKNKEVNNNFPSLLNPKPTNHYYYNYKRKPSFSFILSLSRTVTQNILILWSCCSCSSSTTRSSLIITKV